MNSIFFKILFQQRRRHNVHRITHPNEPSLDEAFTARHWDELRWIMQLGPHLFAHQGVSSLQPTTTREELHQKRKVYVRDSLVRKVRLKKKGFSPWGSSLRLMLNFPCQF